MIIQDYIIRKKEIKPSLGVDTIHNSIFEFFFLNTDNPLDWVYYHYEHDCSERLLPILELF